MPSLLDRLLGRRVDPVLSVKRQLGVPQAAEGGTPWAYEYPREGETSVAAGADVTIIDPGPFTNRLLGVNIERGLEVDVYFDERLFFHSEGNELGDYAKPGRAAHRIRVRIQNTSSDARYCRVLLAGEIR